MPRRTLDLDGIWWRAALSLGAFAIGSLVTGWPAAGVLAGACAWVAPMLVGVRAGRDRLTRRSEAVASWTEMLRDTIAAHAGLQEAIAVTARVAPAPIRTEVQALAIRAERDTLTTALRRFAEELDDPVADLVVASLVIAAERQAQRLAELLGQIAHRGTRAGGDAPAGRDRPSAHLRVVEGARRNHVRARRAAACCSLRPSWSPTTRSSGRSC